MLDVKLLRTQKKAFNRIRKTFLFTFEINTLKTLINTFVTLRFSESTPKHCDNYFPYIKCAPFVSEFEHHRGRMPFSFLKQDLGTVKTAIL